MKSKKVIWLVFLIAIIFFGLLGFINRNKLDTKDVVISTPLSTPNVKDYGKNLPDNFPEDFPIYPGSSITSSFENKGVTKLGQSVTWETEGKSTDVLEYLQSELDKNEWNVDVNKDNPNIVNFSKVNTQGFLIVTVLPEGKVSITAALSLK